VVIGNTQNTYTLAGLPSAASRAAQTGSTNFVTSDAGGNLALSDFGPANIATLNNQVASLDGRVGSLESRVGGLEANVASLHRGLQRSYEGTAIALAMAGVTLPNDKNFAISGNWGTFRGENGFAATAVARITNNLYAHGGVGFGADHNSVGGRAGVTFAW
jgi:hypothetical protein